MGNKLKDIEGFDPAEFEKEKRMKERTKMINYLKEHGIKVDVSFGDDDLKNLYFYELTRDADFLSPDLIYAEQDAIGGAVVHGIFSVIKNWIDCISIPDITKLIESPAIGIALTIGGIAIKTSDDIGKDIYQRRDKIIVLEDLDIEDSVFRIYSSFNNHLDKIPKSYKEKYPSFAKQFAMIEAMNQRPEDANLSRMYQKQFASQLDTIFNSGEYNYLPTRYKDIKDDIWWFNENSLNEWLAPGIWTVLNVSLFLLNIQHPKAERT